MKYKKEVALLLVAFSLHGMNKPNPSRKRQTPPPTMQAAVSITDLLSQGKPLVFQNVLDLSDRQITSLNGLNEIPNPSQVEVINLNNNNLTNIPMHAFEAFTHLTTLRISGNRLTVLPADLLAYTPLLKTFDCARNLLTNLPANFFTQVNNLESLSLKGNSITLSDTIFVGLNTLKTLDLRDMELRTLPTSITSLENLTALHLSGNNFAENYPAESQSYKTSSGRQTPQGRQTPEGRRSPKSPISLLFKKLDNFNNAQRAQAQAMQSEESSSFFN